MKTLKKLSNRKLDELQDKLLERLGNVRYHRRLIGMLWKIGNERLRRSGL